MQQYRKQQLARRGWHPANRREASLTQEGDEGGEGRAEGWAAAGVGVPRAVSRPHLELHGARGQAVVAEPVVAQVVDQPVHILGERGQVLEGRGTAAAQPHTTPKPPTPLSHCFPRGVRGSADPLPDSKLSSFFAPHVSKSTAGGKERQLARP